VLAREGPFLPAASLGWSRPVRTGMESRVRSYKEKRKVEAAEDVRKMKQKTR
jgi:hypothetical protein